MDSFGACAPIPIAPKPSNTFAPVAAAIFPSLAPPTLAQPIGGKPRALATFSNFS